MPVIDTDHWLMDFYQVPIELCNKMKPLFPDVSSKDILDYFRMHGMYQKSSHSGREVVRTMEQSNIWSIVDQEHKALKKKWKGPDVPIVILPSNTANQKLMTETKGKAGLAFSDKLILFVPATISEHELKALLIHEYNHVCRLWHLQKDEQLFTLLDSIILEGLAEHAVRERLGTAFISNWTNFYSNEQINRIWNKVILPDRKLNRSHPLHNQLLYGWNKFPKMAGYCVGYYLVENYLREKKIGIVDILGEESEVIANLSYS
ncbi:DUF2268 domain-containing protein [Sporosarcina aquimarina]|uniref:DUF2268 domain-containing protein n=1 Tax=Sporosarcina aquimarina TaxID=114975 RepID=A0ABU4FXK7_9BACL|nr:DUF2268 domain-containing protein [Sporosarcina aquimarina]MDW0109439.1 DUF2268 domain-containing protein [Sporosarcina aquimarina]